MPTSLDEELEEQTAGSDDERRRQEFEAYQQQQRLQQQQEQQQSAAQKIQNVQDTVQKVQKLAKWGKRLMWLGQFLLWSFPVWGPIVLVLFIALSFVGGCNGSTAFRIASLGSCEPFIIAEGGRSGGAGGGATFEPPPPTGGDPNGVGCQNCVTLTSAGVPIKAIDACAAGFGACQIESVVSTKLAQLNSNLSGWQVTEAWPPTGYSPTQPNGIHQNSCHGNATCVDANFINQTQATAQNISNFISQSNTSGLRAVYEVPTQAQANQLIGQGVPTSNIQVVAAITAPHFSVYNR